MSKLDVRITGISIENFKNVISGQVELVNTRKAYRTSILGIYGQNGSGKTALIDAILLLKYNLCGQRIPPMFADYIQVDADFAKLRYVFSVKNKECEYEVFYEFCIKKEEDVTGQNSDITTGTKEKYKTVVYDEVISYSYESKSKKMRKSTLIDTRTDELFLPAPKRECLIGNDKKLKLYLLVTKRVASASSRSFIFSPELINNIRARSNNNHDTEFLRHYQMIESLITYGNFELFVINTANSGVISMNALPLAFKYEKAQKGAVGNMVILLDGTSIIPEEMLELVKKVMQDMNIVLEKIVPGLTISVKDLGKIVQQDGQVANRIQLMSQKNNKEIPLKYESEGIKKIVSILQLLIVIYNQTSITVAIDELDSGVFEYLLGEILRILSEKGKGQLIFTSHNLRPLETLDKGFIAFTTTNPKNRYIRMSGVKENNNLRDFYFRDIVLGEQNEEVYDHTNNAEIALAFREAGEISGS